MTAITELQAGRELDALVAEKVMGLPVCDFLERKKNGTLPCNMYCSEYEGRGPHYHPAPISRMSGNYNSPAYSTDIAAAWEVVEKLKTPDHRVEIEAPHGDPHWICRFWRGPDILGGAGDETMPLAICRAALKAVGA